MCPRSISTQKHFKYFKFNMSHQLTSLWPFQLSFIFSPGCPTSQPMGTGSSWPSKTTQGLFILLPRHNSNLKSSASHWLGPPYYKSLTVMSPLESHCLPTLLGKVQTKFSRPLMTQTEPSCPTSQHQWPQNPSHTKSASAFAHAILYTCNIYLISASLISNHFQVWDLRGNQKPS